MSQLTSHKIDKALFPEGLRDVVVEFSSDKELEDFVEDCKKNPHTWRDFFLLDILSVFMPDYEAHGVLGMYPMHVLSTAQWEELVPESARSGKLLDIGAGQGFVTEKARHLFSEITTTETSHSMAKRLRARGFIARTEDIAEHPDLFEEKEFDIVSILNVLDRCLSPMTLLQNATKFLKDDGLLIITDPLPLQQRMRTRFSKTKESLGTRIGNSWEADFVDFYEKVLKPNGLVPVRVSRVPYVCKLSAKNPFISLDDFLVVCKKG